jgi:hypothetical protein
MLTDDRIIGIAIGAAKAADIPAPFVLALVEVESGGNPWAWNPEPAYRYYWNTKTGRPFRALTPAETASRVPPCDFPAFPGADRDAEFWGQGVSWGLMQVMGAVARERGFGAPFLTALCDPAENCRIGVAVFRSMMERFGKAPSAIAAYNAGSPRYVPGTRTFVNQSYVDRVLAAVAAWTKKLEGPPL